MLSKSAKLGKSGIKFLPPHSNAVQRDEVKKGSYYVTLSKA
jgi:hypothetical protein